MRKKKLRPADAIAKDAESSAMDISSMVDVAFLLVIFFLVTSAIRKEEADLNTRIPTDKSSAPSIETLVLDIAISGSGSVHYDGQLVSKSSTDQKLAGLIAAIGTAKDLAGGAGQPILAKIDASDDASHQRFTDVLNALAAAEIENISISGVL